MLIKTFGCKVNQADSAGLVGQLAQAGLAAEAIDSDSMSTTQAPPAAVLVNSCCVTAEAERKALQFVRRMRRRWPDAPVVLTGCAARADGAEQRFVQAGAQVLPWYGDAMAFLRALPQAAADAQPLPAAGPLQQRARGFVKVQDGCCNYCTYCIVPHVRAYASRPVGEILADIDAELALGRREFVLTGVNIGHYGTAPHCPCPAPPHIAGQAVRVEYAAIPGGLQLDGLVELLLARLPDGARLRISSIEPETVTPRLFELLAHPRMCPHLHLPLQSASARVLQAMGRRYTYAQYAELVARFRQAYPWGAVTTDLLVGFPGESDSDFDETMAAVTDFGFERLHCFAFSPRPGTPAAELPPVQRELVLNRNRELIAQGKTVADTRWARFVGRLAQVTLEEASADPTHPGWTGYGEAYQHVHVSTVALDAAAQVGHIVPVRLTGYADGMFSAVLER